MSTAQNTTTAATPASMANHFLSVADHDRKWLKHALNVAFTLRDDRERGHDDHGG